MPPAQLAHIALDRNVRPALLGTWLLRSLEEGVEGVAPRKREFTPADALEFFGVDHLAGLAELWRSPQLLTELLQRVEVRCWRPQRRAPLRFIESGLYAQQRAAEAVARHGEGRCSEALRTLAGRRLCAPTCPPAPLVQSAEVAQRVEAVMKEQLNSLLRLPNLREQPELDDEMLDDLR